MTTKFKNFLALVALLAAIAGSAISFTLHRKKCGKHCPTHGAHELCDNEDPAHTVCTFPCQHMPAETV